MAVTRKTAYVEDDGTRARLSSGVGGGREPWLRHGHLRMGVGVCKTQVAVRLRAVTARNRDVELGIAPHPVLGDVEAGRLDMGLHANPPEPLQRPERAKRGGER